MSQKLENYIIYLLSFIYIESRKISLSSKINFIKFSESINLGDSSSNMSKKMRNKIKLLVKIALCINKFFISVFFYF